MRCEYKYKFNLKISHSIEREGEMKNIHFHDISIAVFVLDKGEKFIMYDDTEKKVRDYIKLYNEKYINEIEPFDEVIPTIENIGREFYRNLKIILGEDNYVITKLEISEIPTRTYIIEGGN